MIGPLRLSRRSRPASIALDFLAGGNLSLIRPSGASYTDAAGVMQMAAADQPRIDHDPVTLAPLGLLIEGAATNLMAWSEEMVAGKWLEVQRGTSTPVSGPGGASGAYRFTPDNGSTANQRLKTPAFSVTSGQAMSTQVVLKSAGVRYVRLAGAAAGFTSANSFFDLQDGTASGVGLSIAPLGEGWFLCKAQNMPATDTTTDGLSIFAANAAGSTVFAGDGVAGFEVWHPQVELGARATSYIPTAGGPATRAADVLAPLSLSGLWAAAGGIGGTILMDVDADGPVNTTRGYLWMISDAGLSRLALRAWNQGVSEDICKIVAGDGTANTDTLIATALRGRQRIAVSYINGAAPLVSMSGAVVVTSARNYIHDPANTTITIGGGFYGHLRGIRIYRRPMTGAQLQALTA